MKILVSYDGSAGAMEALKYALELKCSVDEYYIIYVVPIIVGRSSCIESYRPQSSHESLDKTADQVLEKAKNAS